MGKLRLTLLGQPQVWHDEVPIPLPSRKALALLIYLALEKGLHRREELAALLWQESDEVHSRAGLRQALAMLRKALKDGSAVEAIYPGQPAEIHHLLVTNDALGIDPTHPVEIDLNQIEKAAQQARQWQKTPGAEQTPNTTIIQGLTGALALDHGLFLEGFSFPDASDFDQWVETQRVYWLRQINLLYDRLSQMYRDQGNLDGAIQTAERWLQRNPTDEPACRRLMELYQTSRDRFSALNAFERFSSAVKQGLAAEPSAELAALAERIRREAQGLVGNAMAVSDQQTIEQLPFVGREAPFQQLVQAFHELPAAGPQTVLILGEAGIGKTRLVNEFLAWSGARGADPLFGKSFETGGRLPYQPVMMALRDRLEHENAPEDLLADVWLVELSRLIPELRERYPDLPPPAADTDESGRSRLFEATMRLGLAMAQRRSLVLVLDDLQWADAATLDLVRYCLARWQAVHAPVLTIFTLRLENSSGEAPVSRWLVHFQQEFSVKEIRLNPLVEGDIRQLARALEVEDMDKDHFSTWLIQQSEGVPLYLQEMIRSVRGQRDAFSYQFQKDTWIEPGEPGAPDLLPERILTLIRGTLTHLSPAARSLLLAAAVLGQDFNLVQICRMLSLDELQVLPLLEELLASRMLVETGPEKLSFSHDKVRIVVYREGSETRRRVLHRRAFEALEALAAPPARIAHQARRSGLHGPAFRYSLQAARANMSVYAVADAIQHFRKAKEAAEGLEADGDPQNQIGIQDYSDLYLQLGRACELEHDWASAEHAYQALREKALQANDIPLVCLAINRLATLAVQSDYRIAEASSMLSKALDLAHQCGSAEMITETEWNLAQISVYRNDVQTALQHAQVSLQHARQIGSPELVARSLNVVGFALSGLGRWQESEPLFQEAIDLFAALGNRPMQIDCLTLLSQARLNTGNLEAAIPPVMEADRLSREIQNQWSLANCGFHFAMISLEQGHLSQALREANEALSAARQITGFAPLEILILIISGNILRAMRAPAEAHACHLEALSISEKIPVRPFARTIMWEICADLALLGNWKTASEWALKGLTEVDQTLLHGGLYNGYVVEVLLHEGHESEAKQITHALWECYPRNPRYALAAHRCSAMIAQYQGDYVQAVDHYQSARALALEMGLPIEQMEIDERLAEVSEWLIADDQAQAYKTEALQARNDLAEQIDDLTLRAQFLDFIRKGQ